MKKYEFTGEEKNLLGRTLRQIRATAAIAFARTCIDLTPEERADGGKINGWI